jgi:hypothetical protein
MNVRHVCTMPVDLLEEDMGVYVSTCLRGAAHAPATGAIRRRLARCPACAAEAANALAMLKWWEAEAPFNRNALPVPDLARLIGAGAGKGAG